MDAGAPARYSAAAPEPAPASGRKQAMKHVHLTAKYRPQRFADVVGQEAVKAVLSRASAEDRVAPAYLFSGTRGVGKTTIARILAKALNCETAPTAEPCGVCRFCTAIAAGSQMDVVEFDAASHTGVDDVRALKENIGFAPMEARYKVFIIDEAHMLSKSAFNALLKTLEEPPAHATFIMASTEPHKFPATIISRCQHYVFKGLPVGQLEEHLRSILRREAVDFEDAAVSLIARRGAGSVRDSMSLLSQALALGASRLDAAAVRELLGLADQEALQAIVAAIHAGDCLAVGTRLRQVLDQGLDLGFFLRELAGAFRSMFLLRQAGDASQAQLLSLLDMPEAEAREWLAWAQRFDLGRIHASWQLLLEGQRRVLRSLEPALALELLLFNLASLPQLLPLESVGMAAPATPARQQPPARPQAPYAPPPARPDSQPAAPVQVRPAPAPEPAAPVAPAPATASSAPEVAAPAEYAPPSSGSRDWEGFLALLNSRQAMPQMLRGVAGSYEGGVLCLSCLSQTHCGLLDRDKDFPAFKELAREYFGPQVEVRVASSCAAPKTVKELKAEASEHPAVKTVMDHFGVKDFDMRRK